MIQVKESDIQRLILDWLAAERIWHIRLNTGAFGGVHNGKRRFVRFGRPGMADILAMRPLRDSWNVLQSSPVWIEVKGPKGEQSYEQKLFEAEVKERGMHYILARSLEDVSEILK